MNLGDHLDKLRAFRLIAETGKLSEAAKRLHMSQPSLTRLIQTLEGAAGKSLFHRSRQGVSLTSAGKLLHEFSVSVLNGLGDLEERLKNPDVERAGILRIGSYETLAEYLWPEFILSFKQRVPELKLSVRTSAPMTHQEALETGTLDLLVDAEPRILGDFTSWLLYEDRFNFYGVKGKVPALVGPESVGELPIIYCPQAFDHENKTILRHLEEKGFFFKEKIELDSFPAARTFCQTGMGVAVLPERLARRSVDAKELSPVELKGFSRKGFGKHSICASVLASRSDDSRIRILIKALREHFKQSEGKAGHRS